MKNIYEMLLDIDVDSNKIDNKDVTEKEQEDIIDFVKNKSKEKKNMNIRMRFIAIAASFVIMFISVMYIGIAYPTYANTIPVIKDIFKFLDRDNTGVFDLYKQNAHEVNIEKESNGIKMKINDIVYDGKTISYTYEIRTDKDLGEGPLIGKGPSFSVKGYKGGMSGSEETKKIEDGLYIGKNEYSLLCMDMKEIDCMLDINNIIKTSNKEIEEIKCKFKFRFKVDSVNSDKKLINKMVEKDGFKVTINNITNTPMSVIFKYMQQVPKEYRTHWDSVTTELLVKDDLGNEYKGEQNGGNGNIKTGIMNCYMTFGKINKDANKLIITPMITCSVHKGGVAFDEKGNEVELKSDIKRENKIIKLDDIIYELDK